MNKNQLEQLIKIYNTLTMIYTKGEDTLIMADCLKAFRQSIYDLQTVVIQQDDIKE